ncbi:MAG: hypothetical protein ACODAQ_12655, partial [Phycisphaeraceae bacterium]
MANLDDIMERASEALARMDYLTAESLCLEALQAARAAREWSYYARILLPLQEARRQRRMIAAEGVIRLGTARLSRPADDWLDSIDTGCLVVTHPHTAGDARTVEQAARRQRRYIEVLFADNAPTAETWTIRAHAGPDVRCDVSAPPATWQDTWLPLGEQPEVEQEHDSPREDAVAFTPADWFIDATEALGDAALAQVAAEPGEVARIEQLEAMLQVVT